MKVFVLPGAEVWPCWLWSAAVSPGREKPLPSQDIWLVGENSSTENWDVAIKIANLGKFEPLQQYVIIVIFMNFFRGSYFGVRSWKSPWLNVNTAQQQLNHQSVISINLILNPSRALYQLLGKKLTPPAKTRTYDGERLFRQHTLFI